jgi:hypothetical protein
MPSKHPYAELLIRRGLYDNLHSFAELEQRISALGDENSKAVGDAFEVFVEGYLATHQKLQVEAVWLVGQVPQGIRQQMNLPNDAKGIENGVAVIQKVRETIGTSRASVTSMAMATATFSGVRTAAARSISGRWPANRFKRRALSSTLSSPTTGTSRASVTSTAMATATFSGVRTAAARSMSGR